MAGWLSSSLVVPVVWFALGLVKGARAGEYCWSETYLKYCRFGCCGSTLGACCSLDVALIVGCVVGGVVCVAFIVTVVCCVIKKQGYRGRVVGPHAMAGAGNNVTVVHSNNTAMGYAQPPPPPPPPPGTQTYSQAAYPPYGGNQPPPPPPPYVYSNPAYPPQPAADAGGRNGQGGGFAAPAAPGYHPSTAAP